MKLTAQEKANNAIKWIDGLAKTKTKQGKDQLGNSEFGYCCLGYGCMKLNIKYNPFNSSSIDFQKQVGLSYPAGKLKSKKYFLNSKYLNYDDLTELNDDLNYSFNEISKEIKKHLKDLFVPSVSKILIEHYSK